MSKPHLLLARDYWKNHLKTDDFAIDATCGNGHDTLYLSGLLPDGLVYGIDIQESALEKTREILGDAKNVRLFCQSHAEPIPIPKPPRLIVYNLGYLPGGD
jgi:ubiquinone/menaquinone biosynthesis C-methylase UbiE